jgi:hypothetical protein
MTPVPVPLTFVSLPDRDATSNAPPSKLALRSVVTIDVHRSLDRVKDASSLGASDGFSSLRRVHVLLIAHADDVPLLGVQGTPAVIGGSPIEEETPIC